MELSNSQTDLANLSIEDIQSESIEYSKIFEGFIMFHQ